MRRVLWLAVGAAGGIYAYRRGEQALARARERGLTGNLVVLAKSGETAYERVRVRVKPLVKERGGV